MKKETLVLLFFILLKFALQYALVDTGYDLHRDEYLHLDQAHHLAWGYLSVPPFTSWISWLVAFLGNGVFWVRFFPALFGALTLWIVWKTTDALGGGLFAKILAATALLLSAFLRLNMLYQPTSADAFFWTLLFFTLIRYFQTDNTKWIWFAAVSFAMGLLNKYSIAFLGLGLAAALLMTPQRKIFAERQLYLAGLLALAIFSPNLFWQWQNGFPVVHHMNELAQTQLEKVNRIDFAKEQVLFFIGSFFVVLGGLTALALTRAFRPYRFVFWGFAFTIALFVFFRAKGYYAIGLYPILLAFGGTYWEVKLSKAPRRMLRPLLIAIPVLMFIPIFKIAFPVSPPQEIASNSEVLKKFGLLRWEDGKDHALPQDFADMISWREMAALVDRAYASIPNASENTLVLCDNYGQAGAVNYYTRFKSLRAVSFNADYLYWIPNDKKFVNVIAVKQANDDDRYRVRETPLFKSIEAVGQIQNRLAREFGTKVFVYRNARVDINGRIASEASVKKNRWKE